MAGDTTPKPQRGFVSEPRVAAPAATLGNEHTNNGGRGEKHPPNPPFAETATTGGLFRGVSSLHNHT